MHRTELEGVSVVTVKGLIALVRGCRRLSRLRIHFQIPSPVEVATGPEIPALFDGSTVVRQQDRVLTTLEVGEISIPGGTVNMVAMILPLVSSASNSPKRSGGMLWNSSIWPSELAPSYNTQVRRISPYL